MKLVLFFRQRRDISVFAVISLVIATVLFGQVGSIQANHSVRPVAASGLPLTQFARDQVDTERHAIRLLHRAHLQAELFTLEITWKQRWAAAILTVLAFPLAPSPVLLPLLGVVLNGTSSVAVRDSPRTC
jgi:hypothetical protein